MDEQNAQNQNDLTTDSFSKEEKAQLKERLKRLKGPQQAEWFVVHTYSGHENNVQINLKKRLRSFSMTEQVEDIFIPTQDKIEVKEGKRKEVTERLFPGYILVKMRPSDEVISIVKGTPGVTGFVGTNDAATPLSEKEVEAIRQFSEQDAPQYEAQFSVGEGVKIIDGPFTDFIGTVDKIDQEKGVVNVLINIFGRETPVELDFLQIGKL